MFTPCDDDEVRPNERFLRVRVPEGVWAWSLDIGRTTTKEQVIAAARLAVTDYIRNLIEPQLERQLEAIFPTIDPLEGYTKWRLELHRRSRCP